MDPSKDPSYRRLISQDWCARWLKDPNYRIALIKAPPQTPELEGALLGKSLRTEDTIRAALCVYKVENDEVQETVTFFDIGTGVNGLPGAAHGGMVATLLDEACGIFAASLVGPSTRTLVLTSSKERCATIWPASATATVYLNVTYVKFVKTPSVVAIRCRLKERSGRKLFVNGQMEDSNGTVLSKVEALFILTRQSNI